VSRTWIRDFVHDALNLTFRCPTTAAQKLLAGWKEQVDYLAYWLAFLVHSFSIPEALVVNMDQRGMHLVPTGGSRTYEKKGRKEVAVAGTEDKRQITIMVSSAADGTTLAPQLIFQGKTDRSMPAGSAVQLAKLDGWTFEATENHWSNLVTTKKWEIQILEPYHKKVSALKDVPAKLISL
jgi:hypothetical protein